MIVVSVTGDPSICTSAMPTLVDRRDEQNIAFEDKKDKTDIPLRQSNHPEAYFPEEVKGWHGYVEWEMYPEKQKKAIEILKQYKFAEVHMIVSS